MADSNPTNPDQPSRPLVTFKKRGKKGDKARKKRRLDEIDEQEGEEGADGTRVVRPSVSSGPQGREDAVTSSSAPSSHETTITYSSTGSSLASKERSSATAGVEVDTEAERDAVSDLERHVAMNLKGEVGDGVYRGESGYRSYTKKDERYTARNKFTGTQGPLRAPSFIRSTTVVDYNPEICTDYKNTGYCGYGQQCKFIHDRGDYKSGYQIDQEWEELQKKKREKFVKKSKEGREEEEDNPYFIPSDDEEDGEGQSTATGLPSACPICGGDFVDPVQASCGHCFCGRCVLANREHPEYANTCHVCGRKTFGIFNRAKSLVREIRRRRAEEAEAAGNEFSEFGF